MKPANKLIVIPALGLLVLTSCEFKKTEYRPYLDPVSFSGFEYGYFILYNNSISYYSPDDNQVFPDLYEHQNGNPPGNGIHSFHNKLTHSYGLITYQEDNRIEIIENVNLLSEGVLEIEKPRDIFSLRGRYCTVSFGDPGTGGIAVVDLVDKEFAKTVHTGIEAGEIYRTGNYLYVFSDGNSMNDSIIEKFYYKQNTPSSLHKLDSLPVGIRPVDFAEITIPYEDHPHAGLAILCKGNDTVPASIVLFDLVTENVIDSNPFESTDIVPENLFWFPFYRDPWQPGNPASESDLVCYVSNKLFSLNLNKPVEMSVLINKNVSFLLPFDDHFLAVSRDTIGNKSYLYRFDPTSFELVDSLSIPPKALKLVGRGY